MTRWEAELYHKFDLPFELYGKDFLIRSIDKWHRRELVIASMDLVKPTSDYVSDSELRSHFARLEAAPEWDLVVIDEAHHLTPPDAVEETLLFKLVASLRNHSRAMLLLTGTPHVGDSNRFRKLMKLARPDLTSQIDDPNAFDRAVREIMIRTRKDDVTDHAGNFLLKGIESHLIKLQANESYLQLERELDAFIGRSLDDDEFDVARSRQGLPISRKLLASSVEAVEYSLRKRLDEVELRVRARRRGMCTGSSSLTVAEVEVARLRALLARCEVAKQSDPKQPLMRAIYDEFVCSGHRKVLIFTEFRVTQRWVIRELQSLGANVGYIHGEQTEEQKRAAIDQFEQDADVLVSTDAGAEGFNIHSGCHIVVNFDLPWNPMNLEQRAGRVYRIGQRQRTIVLNATVESDYSNYVLTRSRSRAKTIAAELRTLSPEFDDVYAERLFGRSLSINQIKWLLHSAAGHSEIRDASRIDAAIGRARGH